MSNKTNATTSRIESAIMDRPLSDQKERKPVLILMHFLGGSWKEWASVIDRLGNEYCCVGVDLPGFGGAAEVRDYSVSQMMEYLADFMAELQVGPFLLVGHSMSGKVAMAAARANIENPSKFEGLQGLVLVASSPPEPEPMDESKRDRMVKTLGQPQLDFRRHAEAYIRENVATKLSQSHLTALTDDVLRMNPAAWKAWLVCGSKEDWSERIGTLDLPVLVVAGEADTDLGPEAQRKLVLPHLSRSRLEIIRDCAHLVPVERPAELAELIMQFAVACEHASSAAIFSPPIASTQLAYRQLINSNRVSSLTRHVLQERSAANDKKCFSEMFSPSEVELLTAIVVRVIPLSDFTHNLTARLLLEIEAGEGSGKGWRYAELPSNAPMYHGALATLEHLALSKYGVPFTAICGEQQDEVLTTVQLVGR